MTAPDLAGHEWWLASRAACRLLSTVSIRVAPDWSVST